MTLRKSEAMLRLLVGLALGFGFIGFATHGNVSAVEEQQCSDSPLEADDLPPCSDAEQV